MSNTTKLMRERGAYEHRKAPREPDVAVRTRKQHDEYLAIIDGRLEDDKSISSTDGRFLLDEIDRRARETNQMVAVGVAAGVGVGAALAGLTGWLLTRRAAVAEPDEESRPPASERR